MREGESRRRDLRLAFTRLKGVSDTRFVGDFFWNFTLGGMERGNGLARHGWKAPRPMMRMGIGRVRLLLRLVGYYYLAFSHNTPYFASSIHSNIPNIHLITPISISLLCSPDLLTDTPILIPREDSPQITGLPGTHATSVRPYSSALPPPSPTPTNPPPPPKQQYRAPVPSLSLPDRGTPRAGTG